MRLARRKWARQQWADALKLIFVHWIDQYQAGDITRILMRVQPDNQTAERMTDQHNRTRECGSDDQRMQIGHKVPGRAWYGRRVAVPTIGAIIAAALGKRRKLLLDGLPFIALSPQAGFEHHHWRTTASTCEREPASIGIHMNQFSCIQHQGLLSYV